MTYGLLFGCAAALLPIYMSKWDIAFFVSDKWNTPKFSRLRSLIFCLVGVAMLV